MSLLDDVEPSVAPSAGPGANELAHFVDTDVFVTNHLGYRFSAQLSHS